MENPMGWAFTIVGHLLLVYASGALAVLVVLKASKIRMRSEEPDDALLKRVAYRWPFAFAAMIPALRKNFLQD
jgi:hypothetical protein